MSSPDRDGNQYLSALDGAWDRTKRHWQDQVSRTFDAHHWRPLQTESRAYLAALHELLELLSAAERDTEY